MYLRLVSRRSDNFWLRYMSNSIFDLEHARSRSWPRSNPMVTFEAQGSVDVFASCFTLIGTFLSEI